MTGLEFKRFLGCIAIDLPHYAARLAAGGDRYLSIRNRDERLEIGPQGLGWRCDWQWTRSLHAPRYLPALGKALLRRSLEDHPVHLADAPESAGEDPQLTFVIGHRGRERLPLLLQTLRSIAGQRNARVECVVVEQDAISQLAGAVPAWVRVIHTPPPAEGMPYARSWALNTGSRHARAPVLVLHDNDMLVPADYAAEVLALAGAGYEVINLKRFVFYLTQDHTRRILEGEATPQSCAPEQVVQNLEAGGSVAITREAFARIGAMDESFIGWGGEDNEFWERARTLKAWPWAWLPIVHLWHASQPRKHDEASPAVARYRERSGMPAAMRVEELRSIDWGSPSGPQFPS